MSSLADRGHSRIEWAGQRMLALRGAANEAGKSPGLSGLRIGVSLTLEPKTAVLLRALNDLGAEVAVYDEGHSADAEVVAALTKDGILVFAEAGASAERDLELRESFVDFLPQLLLDDGASIVRHIHAERTYALSDLIGVSEETTSGVAPLRLMAASGTLRVPCVAANDAPAKTTFDNGYGTGQSVVMSLLDVANVQMPGARVIVIGYGPVGQGIARFARAMGAVVTVTEVDPMRALLAHHDGYKVSTWAAAAGLNEIVFTATGVAHTLTQRHLQMASDGTIFAVGGAGPPELDLDFDAEVEALGEVRAGIDAYRFEDRTVFVVANGECVNCTAGEGNPIEIMDLSMAIQLYALSYLADHGSELEPGVYELPDSISQKVAMAQLEANGISIDEPTEAQKQAVESW